MGSHQLDPRSKEEVARLSPYPMAGSSEYQYIVRESAGATWVSFGALMLIMLGSFHVIQGFVALFRDEVFVVGRQKLIVDVSYTTWGWVHMLWGALAILTAFCLLAGQMWARIVAIVVAFVSALGSVAFLPAYPVWSLLIIVLDIVVIWAIVVHGGELKKPKV
jgi:hypothetical protein